MSDSQHDFLTVCGALNDETRILILRFLSAHGTLCVCDLQSSLGMIQSRLSRHLKILKEAGMVEVERKGTWAFYGVKTALEPFRKSALEEILRLEMPLPPLQRASDGTAGCKIA
jgi:ArsR family transcriptional regulator, arsenate/arsenite/antimonite-responsive transcriptional repressor